MMMEESKMYFTPGMLVRVRHEIENKPTMWVVDKTSRNIRNKDNGEYETMFLGIKCRWFDNNGDLQEATFSTKDIERVE